MSTLTISEGILAICWKYKLPFYKFKLLSEWLEVYTYVKPEDRLLDGRFMELLNYDPNNFDTSCLMEVYLYATIAEFYPLESQHRVIEWILEHAYFRIRPKISYKNVLENISSVKDKLL